MSKSEGKSRAAKKLATHSKNKAVKSFPVSRREETLRKKLDNLNYELDEKRAKITDANEQKFAKLQKKIAKSRARQEAKITRRENSKLFAKNRIIYLIISPIFAMGRFFRMVWRKILKRQKDMATRRPHHSFYLTPRAKTRRGIKMRGYFSFMHEVGSLIWKNRRLFIKFLVIYSVFTAVIVGMLSQENFTALRQALDQAPDLGFFSRYSALFSGAVAGNGGTVDAGQQVLAVLLFLYGWLTLIWLLRRILNGDTNNLRLRDGLYNGGAPVLATFIVLLIILLQLLPFALVLLAYSSVTAVGWINTGIQIENMAAWCALAIAVVLTIYWICSSFLALIIVTLPGMYPGAALRAAGDLVVSRRLSVVLRLVAMVIPVVICWLILLLPVILLDGWLVGNNITWVPVVPLAVLILTTLTIIWCASYIYLLYRKIVDDPTPPVVSPRKIAREKRNAERANKNPTKKSTAKTSRFVVPKFISKILKKG